MFRARRVLCMLATTLALACTSLEPTPSPDPQPPGVAEVPEQTSPARGPTDPQTHRSGPLEAQWQPQFGAVPKGVAGDLNLMIRLRGQGEAGERPPLELAIVLDRSSSMSGDKIRAVKQAAIEMVGELTPEDAVTLVSYSTDVQVHGKRVVDGRGSQWLRGELLRITSQGGTALGPALFRAIEELAGARRSPDALAHVLLLSDGLANQGESNADVIANRAGLAFIDGVSTSTLGVGLDYNEDLMTKVADAAGGRYHFIESDKAVARVLADELAGLTSTVARNVELTVDPAPGVKVDEIYGYPTTQEGDRTTARVGALAAEQSRAIVIRLHYEAPQRSTLALGRIDVDFVDAITGTPGEQLTMMTAVDVVDTPQAAAKTENLGVTIRVVELEAAAELQQATRAMEHRDFEGAKKTLHDAIEDLQTKQAAMPAPSPELDEQIEELQEAARGVDKAKDDERSYQLHKKSFKSKAYKRRKK